jgi:hypothetical protein
MADVGCCYCISAANKKCRVREEGAMNYQCLFYKNACEPPNTLPLALFLLTLSFVLKEWGPGGCNSFWPPTTSGISRYSLLLRKSGGRGGATHSGPLLLAVFRVTLSC